MDLSTALQGLNDAREKLGTRPGVLDPNFISTEMMRLAQYTAAVEAHLAQYEYDLELDESQTYKSYLLDRKLTATAAEKLTKADLSEQRAQIKKLSRLVSSAWKTISICQSRVNHLNSELKTGNQVT